MHKHQMRQVKQNQRDNYIPTVRYEKKKSADGKTRLKERLTVGRSHFGNGAAQRRSANTHPGKRDKYKKSYDMRAGRKGRRR